MSGNLAQIHHEMENKEFIDDLKLLSVSKSSKTYLNIIERLTNHVKRVTSQNAIENNYPLVMAWIDHFHEYVPLLEMKLSSNVNEERRRTEFFLRTCVNVFETTSFFGLFSSVKDFSRHRTIFQTYFSLIKEIYFQDDCKYDDLACCILPIVSMVSIFVPLNENDFPPTFLSSLLTFANHHWHSSQRISMIRCILSMIKVWSKKPAMVPVLIRYQWPEACIRWLSDITSESLQRDYPIDYLIHLILQKLARHTAGVQILNELNCITVLNRSREHMRRVYTEDEYFKLQFVNCMIAALLMEADEIKQTSVSIDQDMLQIIDQLALTIIDASHSDVFMSNCFHISEPLIVLSKLFVNDNFLIEMLTRNNHLFECFCQLFVHFATSLENSTTNFLTLNEETLLVLSNILWSISFHERYRNGFKTNSILMHTLVNLASSPTTISIQSKSIPRDLSSLKKATEGILWNLKASSVHTVQKTVQQQQPLAMISYSHSDSTFCRELVEQLSSHVPVWVDYKQAPGAIAHSDDLWEEIARAMEMATVIILIVSKDYYDSKSCRQELSYASDTLKKRIIPVYAPNQQYRASGWLGIRIAGQKYVHFGRKVFAAAITELASMMVTDQKPVVTPVVTPSPLSCTTMTNEEETKTAKNDDSILKDWTSKDIRAWFDKNHIHPDLISLYADQFHTGTALLIYAHHLKYFYCNEYRRVSIKYRQTHNSKQLDTLDFVNFVDALFRLSAEHNPEKLGTIHLSGTRKMMDERITWL